MLTRGEQAALTGLTVRVVRALGHLREAWGIADGRNRLLIEAAARALITACVGTVPRPGTVPMLRKLWTAGYDQKLAEQMWAAVAPAEEA